MAILEVQGVEKIYTTRFGGNQVQALSDVHFSVEQGEYVAVMGESGSGKTTLLNILAALDKPTKGDVLLDGKPLSKISDKALAAFRRENLGFVFQNFNLLDHFTLRDNIFLPLVLAGGTVDLVVAGFFESDGPAKRRQRRFRPREVARRKDYDTLVFHQIKDTASR